MSHSDGDEEDGDFVLSREDSCGISGGVGMNSQQPADVTVLTPDMISKKMFEIVDDVNTVFQVTDCYTHTHTHTHTYTHTHTTLSPYSLSPHPLSVTYTSCADTVNHLQVGQREAS